MSLLSIAEVFGYSSDDHSPQAKEGRDRKWCKFLGAPCCKSSRKDPLGICSFSDGVFAGTVCPNRFVEGDRIFFDVARAAFGSGSRVAIVPELRILKVHGNSRRRIGKIDYIVAKREAHPELTSALPILLINDKPRSPARCGCNGIGGTPPDRSSVRPTTCD